MRKIYYNKLVRDRIPEKIARHGGKCKTRTLSPKQFKRELLQKVGEEASGLLQAQTRSELVSELNDILQVIDEIKRVAKVSSGDIAIVRRSANQLKGGFKKRLFLVWSSDTGYRTNERRNVRK